MKNDDFTIDWLYLTLCKFYDKYQIKEQNFKKVYAEEKGSVKDFAWLTFQKILKAIADAFVNGSITEEKFYQEQKAVYWEMTLFQRRHENKKGNHTYKEVLSNDLKLNKIQNGKYELNAIVICGSEYCCEYCNSFNELSVPLEEAIKNPPLDCNKCTHHYGCRCLYGYEMLK